jgi:hypothetical protein
MGKELSCILQNSDPFLFCTLEDALLVENILFSKLSWIVKPASDTLLRYSYKLCERFNDVFGDIAA